MGRKFVSWDSIISVWFLWFFVQVLLFLLMKSPSLPKKKKTVFLKNEELPTYSCCSINLFDRSDWHFPSRVTALTGNI